MSLQRTIGILNRPGPSERSYFRGLRSRNSHVFHSFLSVMVGVGGWDWGEGLRRESLGSGQTRDDLGRVTPFEPGRRGSHIARKRGKCPGRRGVHPMSYINNRITSSPVHSCLGLLPRTTERPCTGDVTQVYLPHPRSGIIPPPSVRDPSFPRPLSPKSSCTCVHKVRV